MQREGGSYALGRRDVETTERRQQHQQVQSRLGE
jgi:hypothetical protein